MVNCFKGGCEWKRKGTSSNISKSNMCCHQPEIAVWQNEKLFTGTAKILIYSFRETALKYWVYCACMAKIVNNSAVSLIGFYHEKNSVQLTWISVKTKHLHSSLFDKYSNTSGKIEWLIALTQGQFELISMIQNILKFSKSSFWEL